MHLGIFAKTFPRPTLEETLDAVVAHGLTHIQFNMSCAGLPTLPERIDEELCRLIARALRERGLTMAAISGTFNMCDPDTSRLQDNVHRLDVLAAACRWLDTRIITLCTGTLDPHDMWRWHLENVRKSTWERMVQSMKEAVKIADRHEVTLAFEPEIKNVVSSAMRARRLLDEIDSSWLTVVIDPANLLLSGDSSRWQEILDEAFDWLGPDIVLAHAKTPPILEKAPEMGPGELESLILSTCRAHPDVEEVLRAKLATEEGARKLRHVFRLQPFYEFYLACLTKIGFRGALIMHGLEEREVVEATLFLGTILKDVSELD
ncbi:MAG: sugar phosphate isomerase/epimerase family protein [Isosphaerales bacterium]